MPVSHERLKERLLEEQTRLRAQLARFAGGGQEEGVGYGNHMAEDATAVFEQTKDLALRQNVEGVLAQVERALSKFEVGTYGVCESCGDRIDPARLKALPYAIYCMDCQARWEHR